MRQPLSGTTFRKGKETIKKKAKELSMLCDIPVCAVIIGPKGTAETWPESKSDVKTIFDMHKKKKKIQIPDHHHHHGNDRPAYYEPGVQLTQINNDDDHDEIMECLNSKIIAVENRIRFLKKINEEKN